MTSFRTSESQAKLHHIFMFLQSLNINSKSTTPDKIIKTTKTSRIEKNRHQAIKAPPAIMELL
jgi:hypothetical protein